MKSGRPSAWLLAPVASAFALFAWAYREPVFVTACLLALLAARFHRLSLAPLDRHRWRGLLGLGLVGTVVSAGWYVVVMGSGAGLDQVTRTYPYAHHLVPVTGLLLALASVYVWHLPLQAARRAGVLMSFAACIAAASGCRYYLYLEYHLLLALFMLAMLLGAVTSQTGSRGRTPREQARRLVVLALGVAVIAPATWLLGQGLRGAETALLQLRPPFLGLPGYDGFLGAGRGMRILRHHRLLLSDNVVATVSGTTPPGYLRTQVLTGYRDGHWKVDPSEGVALEPEETSGSFRSTHRLPRSEAGAARLERRLVTMLMDMNGAVPLPYAPTTISTREPVSLTLEHGRVLECGEPDELRSFRFEASMTGLAFRDRRGQEAARALGAPEEVLAALRPLATDIAGEAAGEPLEAASRIEAFFRDNFTYSTQVDLAQQGDPTLDFVLNRRPGYCQYFASGMALMLRSLDIPARVVTGFVARELNELEGGWVVRQKDAHAWCEVYDAASGSWVGFDATPPSATEPRSGEGFVAGMTQLRDWLRFRLRRLGDWLRSLHPGEWLAALWERGPVQKILLLAALAGAAWLGLERGRRLWRALRAWPQLGWGRRPTASSANGGEATACFQRVARALERSGRSMGHSQTAEEYLERPADPGAGGWRELAEFIRLYSDLRFDPARAAATEASGGRALRQQRQQLRRLADAVVGALGR